MKPKKFKYHIPGQKKLKKEDYFKAMQVMGESLKKLPTMKELEDDKTKRQSAG